MPQNLAVLGIHGDSVSNCIAGRNSYFLMLWSRGNREKVLEGFDLNRAVEIVTCG